MNTKNSFVLFYLLISILCFSAQAHEQELNLIETDSVLVVKGDANLIGGPHGPPLTFQEQTLTGSYGSVKIFQDGSYDYVSNAAHDVLAEGAKYSEVFAFTTVDNIEWKLTVNITGTNDAPAISKLHYVLNATLNSNLDRASGILRIADVEANQSYFVEQVATENTYGLFSLKPNGAWEYTTKASHEGLLVGESISDSFTITAADGTPSNVSITVKGSKNPEATVVNGKSHYVVPETGSLTLRREVFKDGPNFTESDGWNNHRATVETLFKLEAGKRYSFKAQGISLGDAIMELAGPIAENTTYSVASQPEYGTVTVDQHTGSWLYTINQGVTQSRDYGGFELALTSDEVVAVPANSTLSSKKRTKVGTEASPSEYELKLVGKTITFKGSADGTLTGNGVSGAGFDADMSFQLKSDLAAGEAPYAVYDSSYPRLYLYVEEDGTSTIDQIVSAIGALNFFFDVKATTLLESGSVGLAGKAVAGGNVNNWIARNDSGDYMGKDAEIIITAKTTGYYLLRCFGGGNSGNYDIGDLDLIATKVAAEDFGGDRSLLPDVEANGDLVKPVSWREVWENQTIADGQVDGSIPAALAVNTSFKGNLANGDVDYVKVNLEIEKWYTFEVGGDLSDPKIDLVNADGGWVANGSEDGGVGLNGKVGFALSPGGANVAGDYYLVIQSGAPEYWGRERGDVSGEYVVKALSGVRGQFGHWLENKDSNILKGNLPENDVPVGIGTTIEPAVGTLFSGSIEIDADRDWYKFSLVKDKIYRWDLESISLVKGSIVLRDSTGETLIVHDKLTVGGDGAVETEGSIVHRAEYTGDYYVEVYSDENIDLENPNAATGTFNLSSTELSDDYGGYIISQGHPSYIPLSYDFNEAGYLQAGSRVYSDFYSGIEKYPKDINGNQINLSGNPRGDFDFFGVDLFSSNTYSFATYETEAAVRVGNNGGNYSAITLFDSLGNKVEGGDWIDGFSYTPVTDGYYYLRANSYNGPGGYMITSSFYGDDYSSNPNTRGRVFLGESVAGELETAGDDDWIRADLQLGKRYKFEPDQTISNRQFELYGPGELNNVDVQRALGWGGVIEDGFSKPDIGQDVTTARAIANALGDVNGGVKAHISFDDKDWYKLTFEEGAVYQINLVGMPVYVSPALPDPMLTLFDPNGQFIKFGNNNAGVNAAHSGIPGKDSELVYTATESGTFYVEVKAEANRPIGNISANGPAVSGATTITVDKIGRVLSPGDVLVFSSDAKFTIGVEATVNSTTLEGQLEGAIADKETAYLCDLVISENASDGATSLVLVNPTKNKFKVGDVFEFANNATFTVDAEAEEGVSTLTGLLSGNVEVGHTAYVVGVGGYGLISTKLPVDKIATSYADIIDWTPQYSAPYYLKFASWFDEVGEYLISMSSLPELAANDVVGSSREAAVAFALGDSVTATIDYGGDLDWFQFEMLAGETYAIEVQGAGAGPSSQISIRDRFGKAVEGWDYGDYYGSNEELGIDLEGSKIFYYSTPLYHLDPDTLPRTYYVQIGANIAGDVTFKATHLFDDQKESPLTTGVLNVGDTASGTWENGVENGANIELIHGTGGGDGDWFKTQLIAGNTYKIDVFTDPANRPSMYIFAEDGTLLQPEDAVETIKDGHAQLTYTANRTGDFFIDPINTKSWGGNNIYDLSLVHIADDVASSIKTSATLAVGGETNGNLERVSDRDWFKVNLKRGHVYKFDLSGASLKNPTLRIRDSHGNQLLYNDQINGWWDPSITYTATEDGVYYVDTAGIDSGQFTMKCTNTYSPPEGSNFFIGKAVELKTNQQTDSVNAAVAHTIGNVVQGEIVLENDRRWYKVQLKKSRAYEFHLFGDSMQSPSLYLRDNKGAPVFPCPKRDKERSSGEKLVLQYTAPEDAEYILDAGGFWSHVNGLNTGVATGTFSLQTFDLGLNSYRAVTWDTDFAVAVSDPGLSVLGVGDSVAGSIENAANRDLYKVSLIEGASYKFRIDGELVNGEKDLGVQSRLFLHSSGGTLVVTETNNSLEYKATETGDFFIGVGATTGQPSGLDFRFNSAVPYSYNLKAIQSRARKTEPTANWYAALKDTGISSLVNAGISDNSLSRNEVLEILESVKDGGVVDADELHDLRVLVANHKEVGLSNYVATVLDNIANGDPANQYYTGRDGLDGRTSRTELGNLYPGSSTDRLTKLISKWFLGTDSPATSTQYARLDLPLYFNGAGTEDPRQGSVGDCYLIAAMSAIADTSIGSIDGTVPSVNPGDMIVDNGDGTYGVRFYDNDGAERWVTVDKYVPGHREDKLLFAETNSGESWAMLVEKAYVQLNESDNISQDGTNRYGIGNAFGIAGGDSGQALSHLTGQKASYGFIDSEPGNEWTADKLRALLDQDLPLVFSTGAPCALASSYNVKRRHAYTYESYDPQTQKFYLRNAWGFEHAYVTFEGLQVMGSNIAYLDGTKTKMERIDANSTFSAAFGAYGDDEESEAGLTAVESFGSVTLYTDADNRLYAGSVAQGIKPVRINGQLATLSLNERTAIAAESIGGINQILWRDNYSQALIKMNFDSSWQFLPTDNVVMVSGTPEFNAAELAFGEGGVVDGTAPVITVTSGTDTVDQGTTWTDAGATADTGETVTPSGTVDTNIAGTYTITYNSTDEAGNVAIPVTRTVTVVADTTAPVITVTSGMDTVRYELGATWTDAGATADTGETVTASGTVDTSARGIYTITYNAEDAAGNVATPVTRTVTVGVFNWTTTDGEVTITSCWNSAAGELVIPGIIEGNPVTSIGASAFAGCASLTSVTIPDSVTSIVGHYAFNQCTSLTSITIGNGLTYIPNYTFYDCTSLTSITIPDSVTSIGGYAFAWCTSLASITIPDSVTNISFGVFYKCNSLKSVIFRGSAPTVGNNAFPVVEGATASVTFEALSSFGESGGNWNGLTIETLLPPVITVTSGTNTDYTNTAIATDAIGQLYDKSLHVSGLKIVQGAAFPGQAAVPDLFTEKVAQVVKLMISRSGADINVAAQENMVRTLKGEAGTWHETKPTAQRILRGAGGDYALNPLDQNYWPLYEVTNFQETHATKDMIWYLNSAAPNGSGDADITEVLEHLMHTIHSYGVRGGVSGSINGLSWMPDMDPDWKTRELFLALKQAVDNGVFSLGGYGDENYNTASTFELAAIEYLYLLNFNMWGYSTLWDGGSLAPEWNDNSRTPSGIETNNPLGYALYNKYIKPVLAKPSLSALRKIFQDGDIGDPAQAGLSGYTPGNGIVTDTVERGSSWTDAGATADGGEAVSVSGTVNTNTVGNYTVTYAATNGTNTGTATRTVNVVDTIAPVITVASGTDIVEQGASWTDAGATADTGETVTPSGTVDTNIAGTYPISYTATDASGNVGTATRIVTVGADTTAPVITSTAIGTDLAENSGLGSTVYNIAASDAVGVVSYAIAGTDAALLSVNSETGDVTLIDDPDYETKSSYSFTVLASDAAGNASQATTVTFSISNVDEVVPTITSGATGINLAENSGAGQVVYTITASANDGGTLQSYTIAGTDAALLSVNSGTGIVTLTDDPDYETKNSYSFTVTSSDAAGTSLPTEVTFQITDVDETFVYTTNDGKVTITDCDETVAGELIIPSVIEGNPVTTIGDGAFSNCTSLTSITIPDSVTSIGAGAFGGCTGLTSITIGNSVTSIGDAVFNGCTSLTSITIPDSVTSIGDASFGGCASLTSITFGNGVTSIRDSDFSQCPSLTSITIGNGVANIGEGAFGGLTSLATIEVGENNVNYTIVNGVLFNKEKTSLHTYPTGKTGEHYTIPNGVTSIGNRAFFNCTSLTSITIPDSVTSIGNSAFAASTNLASITIPDSVTSIGASAFAGCASLISITIPDSVTSIGDRAFSFCTNLASITIPDSVTSIGASAFAACTSLASITIPDGVTSIGDLAFLDCTSLTEIIFQGAAPTVGSGVFTGVAAGANALVVNESLSSFGENGDNWNGLALGTIFPPVITVTSGTDILELGSSWADAGATADGQEVVTSTGTVDTNTLGSYTITYTATGRAGNVGTATRTVTVVDTTAPVITLSGSAITTVEAGFPYNDAGATADGQEAVTSTGIVDINTVGNYTITYTAKDASGNVGEATRTVIVEDTISPVITVTTGDDTVERGSSWTNAGATTTEGSISFTGSVNTDAVGTYTITYSATDSSNNTTTATRTVTVVSSGGEDSFGDVVVYPNNSTQLIGQVTIEGEVAESGDVVAIYVGNELRGKQEVITNGGVAWVNVLVNAAGGNETISFKVYDASTGVTHEKSKSSAVISTGGTVGSFASPLMIEMKDFETQTLSLKEGWNLVSFYVEADDMSPATVFAPIQGKLLQVKNLTQSYDPSVPSFLNTLSSLSVKDGYWLKVSEDVSLSVEGAVPAGASITVKSGWNLVGYPRLSGEAVAAELTSLGNTVVQIKDLGSSYDPSVPSFLNTLSTMAPGSGYWLNVNADGTWNVGTVVEISELNFAAVKTRSNHSPEEKAGPSWGEATVYPNIGATVLAKVSIQGKPVAMGSVVGVFVGNELRGLQDVVLNEGMSYVTLNVNLNEAEEVSYRVWNSDDNNEYLVSGTMLLELGEMYGNPELVELNAVEIVNKPLEVFNVTSEPFGFSFNTMAGRNYTVEATGDLRTWKAVELFQGSGGEIRFTAKPASTGKPQFFRVSVE